MHTPLFSVLIATVGKIDTTIIAVRSILDQQGIDPHDIEVVVTDCLKDDSLKVHLDELNDKRVLYMKTPGFDPSLGWDFAYKQSHGKYILWFGDDDVLLPGALKLFADVFARTHAEVVTAQNMYFYDANHARSDRRNSLGVVLFDGKEYVLNPDEVREAIYGFKNGTEAMHFRFGSIASVFDRALCECAIARLGVVTLPHMRTSHSQQQILYGFARSVVGVSVPTAIVGRLGTSLSQNFSLLQKKNKRPAPVFKYSPVSGDLIRNHVAESFLAVKDLLPDIYGKIPFKMSEFLAYRYGHELFFANMDQETSKRLWDELIKVAQNLPNEKERREVVREVTKLKFRARLVQPLKNIGLWNLTKDTYQRIRELFGKDKRKKVFGSSEYLIRLDPYHIHDIAELGTKARTIVLQKTGKDIFPFPALAAGVYSETNS